MDGDWPVEGIGLPHIAHDGGPVAHLPAVVEGKILHQIPGQIGFAGDAPDHGPGPVAGDQVAPVLLQFRDAHPGAEISPGAHEAGRQALLDQIPQPLVGRVEIFRPHAGVLGLPREALLVGPARIEGRHVGIEAGDDLDDGEAFFRPVRGEALDIGRPVQPVAESHPPGVAEPEKRRAVAMFQKAMVRRNPQGAVEIEGVGSGVRDHLDRAGDAVEAGILRMGTLAAEAVRAGDRGGIPDFPDIAAVPERRHPQRPALRIEEDDVERHLVEGIAAGLSGRERYFQGNVRLGAQGRGRSLGFFHQQIFSRFCSSDQSQGVNFIFRLFQ